MHVLVLAVDDDLLVDRRAQERYLHPADELEPVGVQLLHMADRRLDKLVGLVVLLHESLHDVGKLTVLVDVLQVHLGLFLERLSRVAEHEKPPFEKQL